MELYIPPQPERLKRLKGRRSRSSRKRCPRSALHIRTLWMGVCLILIGLLARWLLVDSSALENLTPSSLGMLESRAPCRLTRQDVSRLLSTHWWELQDSNRLKITDDSQRMFNIITTLDTEFQRDVQELLDRSRTVAASVVVLNPENGRLLVVSDHGVESGQGPLATRAFPAASLFKIVTAAAALEEGVLSADSKLAYNGAKHTLYRNNLRNIVNRYSRHVRFDTAFGESINSVFGKIGIHMTGVELLNHYAARFGFGLPAHFDIPVEYSRLLEVETDFQLAELASGFNKDTSITPLHAAELSLIAVNQGMAVPLGIVEQIQDHLGRICYAFPEDDPRQVLHADSAAQLRRLMRATIEEGTCARSFERIRPLMHQGLVDVGGKTGTINNREQTLRYEWFTGYVMDNRKRRSVVLAVLMVHGDRLGARANQIAAEVVQRFLRLERPLGTPPALVGKSSVSG